MCAASARSGLGKRKGGDFAPPELGLRVHGRRFFTLGGAFPISAQMMLFRYLATHDPGASVKAFLIGDVRFERRGQDIVEAGGRTVPLDHYAVSGVIWGRESVWIDDRKQIIAAITFAPSLEPIQAIREGYESALSALLTRAAEDGITDLARITGQLSPPHTEPLAIVGGTVVDGTGRPPLTDATVLIKRDRIVATGPRTTVSVPGNAEVVDAHGKTILPGLWDMHAHHDQVEWGPLYLVLAWSRSNVTRVIVAGSPFWWAQKLFFTRFCACWPPDAPGSPCKPSEMDRWRWCRNM